MNGELVLSGYRLLEPVHINLQAITIVVPQDDFRTMPVIFDFIERYFDKRRFSQQYPFNTLNLNNSVCRDDEFEILYIPSRVDSTELFKIAKKSLLGKITEKIYKEVSISEREKCFNQLNSVILLPINELLSRYNLICESNMNDMLVDLFAELDIGKKKLLLLDLPEQGLSTEEFHSLLDYLNKKCSNIDNVIVYTQSSAITNIFEKPLCYHIVKDNQIWGMDDYDEIEVLLLEDSGSINLLEKERQFIQSLFNRSLFETEYKEISDLFFCK